MSTIYYIIYSRLISLSYDSIMNMTNALGKHPQCQCIVIKKRDITGANKKN